MSELRTVETFVVEDVKGLPAFQEIPGCPLDVATRKLLMAECPIILLDPTEAANATPALSYTPPRTAQNYDPARYNLQQPSSMHVRSFALQGPDLDTVWTDAHGNQYSSVTLKGINFSKPGVMEHPAASEGVVAWGLQESNIIERVLRASQVLTERGVATEQIIGLAEPQQYPWPIVDPRVDAYEHIGLQEYKRRIIEAHWRSLAPDQQTLEVFAELTAKFNDMTFFISTRAADTQFRVGDLRQPDIQDKILAHVNEHYLQPSDEPFDNLPANFARYVQTFLAPRIGKNTAKKHKDLAHGYLNAWNITALGGIVDLDSVHGTALGLGDEPITNKDRAKDLLDAISAVGNCAPDSYDGSDYSESCVIALVQSYFEEVIALLDSQEQAVERLGGIIQASGSMLEQLPCDNMSSPQIVKILMDQYYQLFYNRYPNELSAAFEPMQRAIMSALESEHLAKQIVRAINDNIPRFSFQIVEELISELADPTFDPIAAFMDNDHLQQPIRDDIKHIIATEIISGCAQQFITADFVPPCIRTLQNDEMRHGLMGILVGQHYDTILQIAHNTAQENIPLIESQLRIWAEYERPDSLVPGHASRPNIGPNNRQFWLSTDGVHVSALAQLVQQSTHELRFGSFSEPTAGKMLQFEVSHNDNLREVITDGAIEEFALVRSPEGPVLKLAIEAENCHYVVFVTAEEDGKFALNIFTSVNATMQVFAEQAPPAHLQDSLF